MQRPPEGVLPVLQHGESGTAAGGTTRVGWPYRGGGRGDLKPFAGGGLADYKRLVRCRRLVEKENEMETSEARNRIRQIIEDAANRTANEEFALQEIKKRISDAGLFEEFVDLLAENELDKSLRRLSEGN